ncbi:hypothetical protein BGX27_000608 [Mortierella sp. AM989]|nr:hypothetical protein BGX27_000608 [Mortierella sp. AM989]
MENKGSIHEAEEYDDPIFQSFRAVDHPHLVRIPAVRHPSSGEYYIIWTDITDCFPRVVRIQHDDVYVPFMRDQNLYRVRPHGIKYHPGMVLDVVYDDQAQQPQQQHSTHRGRHSVMKGRNAVSNTKNTLPSTIALAGVRSSSGPSFGSRNGNEHGTKELIGPSSLSSPSGKPLSFKSQAQHLYNDDTEDEDELDQDLGFESEKEEDEVGEDEEEGDKTKVHEIDETNDWKDKENAKILGEAFHDFNEGIATTVQVLQEVERRVKTMLDASIPTKVTAITAEEMEYIRETEVEPEEAKESDLGSGNGDDVETKSELKPEQELRSDSSLVNKENSDYGAGSMLSTEVTEIVQQQQEPPTTPNAATSTSPQSTATVGSTLTPAPPASIPAVLSSEIPSSTSKPVPPSDEIVNLQNVVQRRVSGILKRRYRWIEAMSPKLFIILPDNRVTLGKTEDEFDEAYIKSLTWSDFSVHFLCDCGNIPGFETECFPHLNLQDCSLGHPISKKMEEGILKRFGGSLTAILEALKYGVHLNSDEGDIIIPAETDPTLQKSITLAIKYLSSHSIASSMTTLSLIGELSQKDDEQQKLVSNTPIANVLAKDDFATIKHFFSESIRELGPILTPSGDTRWVCSQHSVPPSAAGELEAALGFSGSSTSNDSEYNMSMGAFRSVITTPAKARIYYKIAEKLTTACVLRLFLDWNLTMEDEEELRQAVAKFKAAFVKIQVRAASSNSSNVPGFEHGYSAVIFEALKNPRIEAFILEHGPKDEAPFYGYDEWYEIKQKSMYQDSLVRFKTSRTSDRINIRILVTDIDRAGSVLRRVVKGLHRFSKLRLIISDVWEFVTITMLKPGQPGSEIMDTEYATGDMLDFFEKRGNLDSIIYNCRVKGDNRFTKSKALTSMAVGYTYSRDRLKIRDVIKNNKRLKTIELENMVQDDPSQIYETYKSLMANHPTLQSLEIKQRHARFSSDFAWRTVSDPTKMTVSIKTYEGDKVASMFQKYASSLSNIQINGITVSDASILEKSLRPKKGPFKLTDISLNDMHFVEPSALEDLRKIITRGDFRSVSIYVDVRQIKGNADDDSYDDGSGGGKGKAKTKMSEKTKTRLEWEAAEKIANFIASIGSKITNIGIWGNSSHQVVLALEARGPQVSILPLMNSIDVRGSKRRLRSHTWISELLFYKSPMIRQVMDAHILVNNGKEGFSNYDLMEIGHLMESSLKKRSEAGSNASTTETTPLITPGFAKALFENPQKVEPLRELSLQDFELQKEDLDYFLKVVDFSTLKKCQLDIVNEITGEDLLSIAAAIPDNCMMESFTISVPGPSPQDSLLCQQWIKQACSTAERHCAVLVNGQLG